MTSDQLLMLFFGLPLGVLAMGLRRGLGGRGSLLLVPVCLLVALYGFGLERVAHAWGLGLPAPVRPGSGPVRAFLPFCVAAVLVGAYGAAMVRLRRRGKPDETAGETASEERGQ
jgi:hypothetical protein